MATRVGLISDTHDLLRPSAVDFLRGSDLILHAGDICEPSVLAALQAIAHTRAVLGNNDVHRFAPGQLPAIDVVDVEGVRIVVVHDVSHLARHALAHTARVVVFGHSHQPLVEDRRGVLFVNPGSAGPRRFSLPISAGELQVEGTRASARTVELRVN